MKGLKKLLTGILAGAMALTMALGTGSAMPVKAAEGQGKITVSNTTQGETYDLYKVFDATFKGDNIAYTYDASNAAFLAALTGENSPFDAVKFSDGTYNITRKPEYASAEHNSLILDFIRANKDNFGEKVDTQTGNGGAITFRDLPYGYYFITSTLGTTVTIDSAAPSATVIDKNQETTIDKQESVDGGTTWKYVGKGTVEDPIPTQAIGSVVNYKLAGTVTQYAKEEKVTFLKFVDTMSEGLTATKDVKVSVVKDSVLTDVTDTATIDYATVDGKTVTTITVPTVDANDKFLYASNAAYEITYTATINEKALANVQNNEVVLKDNNDNTIGTDSTEVVNYQIALKKTDSKNVELAGAEFLLYTSKDINDKTTLVPVVLVSGTGDATSEGDNVYRVAKAGEEGVKSMVTGKTGVIIVKGLKNGDYYFEETAAPAGFNRLTERKHVAAEGYTDENQIPSINNANASITVINTTGSLLPSTGGIGTTIFYIVGAILVIAGVAYFMLRRKAEVE